MIDIWRPLPDAPGYLISWRGRVIGRLGKELKPWRAPARGGTRGYWFVNIAGRPRTVHSLVQLAFRGPRINGLEHRHLDGNLDNNWLGNIDFGTRGDNVRDAVRHGTHSETRKTRCPQGHEYNTTNTRVDANGSKHCRPCQRDYARAKRASNRKERYDHDD